MRCSSDVASILAQLLTVDGHLATGSSVSPILSFFAFYDMWLNIAQIAKDAGCVLTVYMDDITISGDKVPESVVWAIRKQIHSRGLLYHKERHYTRGVGEVTGALIKDGRMIVPNRQRKKAYDTRMKLAATDDPAEAAKLASSLRGLNEQKKQVEGQRQQAVADRHSIIRQRKPLFIPEFLDQARCRSVSPPLCRFLVLDADAEESASCDGG